MEHQFLSTSTDSAIPKLNVPVSKSKAPYDNTKIQNIANLRQFLPIIVVLDHPIASPRVWLFSRLFISDLGAAPPEIRESEVGSSHS